MSANTADDQSIKPVELNVGGVLYTTSKETLVKVPGSLLTSIFTDHVGAHILQDSKGKIFIDRDGVLFRYVLDYMRNLKLVLPENFHERERLKQEAEYFKLPVLISSLSVGGNKSTHHHALGQIPPAVHVPHATGKSPGFITIGYRGTFAFGRDGMADVKFRKLSRILIGGKVSLCREVFKDTLNESRDPDRGENDRYTARFFLKHTYLEQAFDMLQEEGFVLVACCGTGTSSAGEVKPGLDTEESKWQHYNEFIFERR